MAQGEAVSRTARKRLADTKWDDLAPMMEAYAREAAVIAAGEFGEDLARDGIERLEIILSRLSADPATLAPADGEWWALLWGAWFGERLRALYCGEWTMTIYPGTEFAVPTLELPGGSRVYPTMKVHRRLTLGEAEGLPRFHAMLAGRLSAGERGL